LGIQLRLVLPGRAQDPRQRDELGLSLSILLSLQSQLDWHPSEPGRACLFLDGDSGYAGTRNNIPDPVDNHGVDGGNVSFCDGHAEFVSARPESKYIQMIYLATDADP